LELSDEHSIVEVRAGKKMAGRSLIELDIRAAYGCNVVAIKQASEINVSPSPDAELDSEDVLIVIGADRDLARFERSLAED